MSANAQRYAATVLARYEALGLTTDAKIGAAGGVSTSTLTAYRNAARGEELREPRDDTFGKVDASCQWVPGSARTVWNGGDPTPVGTDFATWEDLADPRYDVKHMSKAIEALQSRVTSLEERLDVLERPNRLYEPRAAKQTGERQRPEQIAPDIQPDDEGPEHGA